MSWDQSKFNTVLKDYLVVTSRTMEEALNTKGLFVCRRAIAYTAKTNPAAIATSLGRMVTTKSWSWKSRRMVARRSLELVTSNSGEAPVAALIINKRRGKKGRPGLSGTKMKEAIQDLIAARNRSVAFIKSGWIAAIRILQARRDAARGPLPAGDSTAKMIGGTKGGAVPARANLGTMTCRIFNSAQARHTKKADALDRVGGLGLEQAFDDEAASMEEYMRRKMEPDAAKANALLR